MFLIQSFSLPHFFILQACSVCIYNYLLITSPLIQLSLINFILDLHKHWFIFLSFGLQFNHVFSFFRSLYFLVFVNFLFRFYIIKLTMNFQFFQGYYVNTMRIQTPHTISNSWTGIVVFISYALIRFVFLLYLFVGQWVFVCI